MADDRGSRRPARLPLGRLVSLGVVVVVFAAGCTSTAGTGGASPSASPPETGSSSASPSGPSTTPSVTGTPEPVQLALRLAGPAIAVAAADGAVYASYLPNPNGHRQVIARLDTSTDAVVTSQPLPGGSNVGDDLAVAGDSLWVSGATSGAEKSRVLYRLDASTLAIVDRVDLPEPPTALAVGAGGLWVGAGGHLLLLDPSDGSVLRSLEVDGDVGDLAIDPTGGALYASTHIAGGAEPLALTERDATSGAIEVSVAGRAFGLSVNRLSATSDGVWVSFATGMLGAVVLLRASDLKQIAAFAPQGGEAGSNGVVADVAGGILWVPAAPNPGGFWCADPATGELRGREGTTQTNGIASVVSVPPDVYVGSLNGLFRISPTPACTS